MNRTPEIIFGGDTDVVDLMERLSIYPSNSKRHVLINGILTCKGNRRTQEISIPGNLLTYGISGSKINLNVEGNLECNGKIDMGILKVGGKVRCEESIKVYDITSKEEVICRGPLEAQFAIIGKYLEVTKEYYPVIKVQSLRVNESIYSQGPLEGNTLYVQGDVYYKGYMYFLKSQILGKVIAEDTDLSIAN